MHKKRRNLNIAHPEKTDVEKSHQTAWRNPLQITSQWRDADRIDPALFKYKVTGRWWEIIEELNITLLVTREYEHLVMALGIKNNMPRISYLPIPHPSGLVVDHAQNIVYVASTRNPNQIFDLTPMSGLLSRPDIRYFEDQFLIVIRSRSFPGCLYLHDLALIDGVLYANAVGQNAIIQIDPDGSFKQVWWPKCIEDGKEPIFGRNYIQLNSIAPGSDIQDSFFTASTDRISSRLPGHRNFPVNKRGIIFSGRTREPIVRGLTRPHSARLYQGQLWVNNSGYGELGVCIEGHFEDVMQLNGWTRGLCFKDHIAFVGTSCVIPRFRNYAPGLDIHKSYCGIHAVDIPSGKHLGSLIWPNGNQIFAIDWIAGTTTEGFPTLARNHRSFEKEKEIYYGFRK